MLRSPIATIVAWCAVMAFVPVEAAWPEAQSPKGTPRPTGILGSTDHRVPVSPTLWPWSSIGRINIVFGPSHRAHCTGTLVGQRHVLTAAHCFYNLRLKSIARPHQIHFVAGQARDGAFEADAAVAELTINPAFNFAIEGRPSGNRIAGDMVRHDWAIVALERPLRLKPIPVQAIRRADVPSAAEPGEIARAGYSQDRPFALTMHRGCTATTDAPMPDLVRHQCDSMGGDSGSPILLLRQDAASVIAIHAVIQTSFEQGAGHRTFAAFGVSASAFATAVEAAVSKGE